MMTMRRRGGCVVLAGFLAAPLWLGAQAQEVPSPAAATKLETILGTHDVLLVARVQPLGEIGQGQTVSASAMAVSRPNETTSTRGIRFIAGAGPDTQRQAYVDFEEIERFAHAIDQIVTTLGQWRDVAPAESREMQYGTKGGVGLHLFADRTETGITDRSYLLFADPNEPQLVVAPYLESVDLERFRDALHAGYDWLVKQ